MNRIAARAVVFLLCGFSGAALAGSAPEGVLPETSMTDAKRLLLEQILSGKLSLSPEDHGGCTAVGTVSCPSVSVTGSLANTDCLLNDNTYADTYHFTGTAGQQVTIDLTAGFDTFVLLRNPSGAVAAFDDDSGTGLNSHLVFTLNATGTWAVVANSAFANVFGPYTLAMTCTGSGPGSCTPNTNTLCLSGGRFKVETNYRTPLPSSGAGTAVPLTADSGYFWFFDPGNVEVVVKVLNACVFDPHIWVFSAGLTNVEVIMTVTDTRNGIQNVYTNPINTKYVAVQDTAAFATCP